MSYTDFTTPAPARKKLPLLVLLSGSGTNFAALLKATQDTSSPLSSIAEITHVISNRKDAYGLTRAKEAGIPTTYHNLKTGGYIKKHPSDIAAARAEYDADLADIILKLSPRPEVIVCAGWMHILSPAFLKPLDEQDIEIINLHPALKGEFDGIDAIKRAFVAFQEGNIKRTGVMVHKVIAAVDQGPLVIQREVPINEGDTNESLEERIHTVEWELIVEGTTMVVQERIAKKSAGKGCQVEGCGEGGCIKERCGAHGCGSDVCAKEGCQKRKCAKEGCGSEECAKHGCQNPACGKDGCGSEVCAKEGCQKGGCANKQ